MRMPPFGHADARTHACRLCLLAVLTALQEYATALDAGGAPKAVKVSQRDNGQYVADVWPRGYALHAPSALLQVVFFKA